ncbi:hypothetical protein AB0N62_40755 [Streptomyces sp. NPDC093982]|uniref:hypothetical protein n=1 Tax=Streptomyces sp. NPDC093982 TaxID=3155077 RepID=UPI003432D20B
MRAVSGNRDSSPTFRGGGESRIDGIPAFLGQVGEQAVEVCHPKRASNRGGRKADMLDAIRAAKEALATEHLTQPRLRGEREALRVLLATRHGAVLVSTAAINQLKALIVSVPDGLRAELRTLKPPRPDHPLRSPPRPPGPEL